MSHHHLYISSSEDEAVIAPTVRAAPLSSILKLRILVGLLFTMMIVVEFLTQAMHDHRRVTLDIEGGVRQALLIRHESGYRQILFAGNSLIYDDISQPALRQYIGADSHIYAAGIPGSTYEDWRYGLRSLFARGSEPDAIVFSISPSQFLRPSAVTPLPVSKLWSTQEIFAYNREQRLGLTAFAELLFEHYSTFFSLRDTVRIYVRKVIPGYETMQNDWARAAPAHIVASDSKTEAVFTDRLSQLAVECAPHTRLLLLIAPTNQRVDAAVEPALLAAARNLGIPVIEPVRETEWPLTDYRQDGYHLNAAAAGEFSRLVASDLRQALKGRANPLAGQ